MLYSPDEALHDGVRSVALRRPVPEKLEITETHTDTQNMAINIIDEQLFFC